MKLASYSQKNIDLYAVIVGNRHVVEVTIVYQRRGISDYRMG